MPHSLDWEDAGVYVRFEGTVTADELVATYDEIARDFRSDIIRYVITDYLGSVRSRDMTRTDVLGFAALERGAAYSNATVWRVAVATDPSVIEFLEFFRSLRVSPDPFRIVPSVDAAREWLATHPLAGDARRSSSL
jgi:hypothetical protein